MFGRWRRIARGHLEVKTLSQVAIDLLGKEPELLSDDTIEEWLGEIGRDIERPMRFLMSEWAGVIDAWKIHSWDDYYHQLLDIQADLSASIKHTNSPMTRKSSACSGKT